MYIIYSNEENKNMKKSTKILLIIFILFFIPSLVMGRYIIEGIKPVDNKITFNFDVKGIIAIILIVISSIFGTILYFRFLSSLSMDKVLFFTSVPLVIIYGLILFLLAELNSLNNDFANSVKSILNITQENTYNTILWAVLITIIFIVLLFINYLIICKPVTKVEKIVSRLGDGKVKEEKLNIGGGKQFSNIEHGLNKINNNYKEKDNTLKKVSLETKKFVPKQFFRFLGKNNITELELGNQVKKKAVTMSVKLIQIKENTNLSLEENFNIINSYLNLISPLIRKFGGFIDKYLGDGVLAVFGRSEDGVDCAHAISRAIRIKNRQNKTLPNIDGRISMMSGEVIFGIVGEEERKIPTIISDITSNLEKIDQICKYMSISVVFTKNIIDDLPLNYRLNYRYIGSINIGENRDLLMYEDLDIYPRDVSEKLIKTKGVFENAILEYENEEFRKAIILFEEALKYFPNDRACYIYYNKCKEKV